MGSSYAIGMQGDDEKKTMAKNIKTESAEMIEMKEYLSGLRKNRVSSGDSSESRVVPLNVPTYPYNGNMVSLDTKGRHVLLESN